MGTDKIRSGSGHLSVAASAYNYLHQIRLVVSVWPETHYRWRAR